MLDTKKIRVLLDNLYPGHTIIVILPEKLPERVSRKIEKSDFGC